MKYTRCKNKETGERYIKVNDTGEKVFETVDPIRYADLRKKALASEARKARDDAMSSLGLTKVRGAVSGKVYYE